MGKFSVISSDESGSRGATIRRTCWFYGRPVGCINGADCPHSHDAEDIAELRRQKANRRRKPEPELVVHQPAPVEPCWLYVEGRCDRGTRCPHSHDAAFIKTCLQRWYEAELARRAEARRRILCAYALLREQPCRYFLEGDCAKGNACHYRHVV